jgi:hypothetical protein
MRIVKGLEATADETVTKGKDTRSWKVPTIEDCGEL